MRRGDVRPSQGGHIGLHTVEPELRCHAMTELLAQHTLLDRLHRSRREVEQLEGPKRHADQPVHGQAQVLQDGAHLAILAFAQADEEPYVRALRLLQDSLDGAVADTGDLDAVLQLVERLLRDGAVRPHAVAPQPAGGGQFEMPGERAIVGEEEQPFGIEIEAADRDHPGRLGGQRVEHRGAPLRVVVGRHQALWLVIAPQPGGLGGGQRGTVDEDFVARGDVPSRGLQRLPVDGNPPLVDPALGLTARAQTRAGQCLGDAHGARARAFTLRSWAGALIGTRATLTGGAFLRFVHGRSRVDGPPYGTSCATEPYADRARRG